MEKYPLQVQQIKRELHVGHFLPQQTIHDALRVAVAMADGHCRAWCESWGHGQELDTAFTILQEALEISRGLSQDSNPTTIDILLRIGDFRRERLIRKGNRIDAEQALQAFREVRIRDPGNLRAMIMVGYVYNYQYEMTGVRCLLDKAIENISEALNAGSFVDPLMIEALIFAAEVLINRANFDGCADDLDVMIEILRLGLNSSEHSGESSALLRLIMADGLAARYDVLEHSEDLSESEELIAATQNLELHARNGVYRDLVKGQLFHIRYQKFRQYKDAIASVQAYHGALSKFEKNSTCPQPTIILICGKLARVLQEGYHTKFALGMLYGAKKIATHFWADDVARCEDWHSSYTLAEVHLRLGEIQEGIYNRHLTLDILGDSISHFRRSVKLTSLQDARFGVRAAKLSAILRVRFNDDQTHSFHKLAARHEAVYWIGQLVRARLPFKPSDTQECLMEIGDLVQDLQQGPQTVELLDKALSHYFKAVSIECTDFSQNVGLFVRVAEALTDKGDLTKNFQFYEKAETYLEKIEVLAKERRCYTTGHRPLLARLREAKFNLKGDLADGRSALEQYYRIFHNSKYGAQQKILAARNYTLFINRLDRKADPYCRELLHSLEGSDFTSIKFYHAITYTIDLMLQLISDGSNRSTQLEIIRREARTPAYCLWLCKLFLNKSAIEMVQLYERGRSVLWDRLINSKTQTDMLEEQHKELAIRYRELRRLLANPEEPDPRLVSLPQDRYQTAADLDEIVKKIHSKPGFEDFLLLPFSHTEMQSFAEEGPIVYLVAGHSDGAGVSLNISLHSVSTVDLPKFSENQCRWRHAQLQRVFAFRDNAPTASDQLLDEILKWLWYSAVEPVLRALGLIRKDLDSTLLPRIWWVASSWASRLPMHAAGDYSLAKEKGSACTVMDNVVSSYTPTIRALKYSRDRLDRAKHEASMSSRAGKALLVAMHNTPDRPKLNDALPEVVLVNAILEAHLSPRLLISPRVTRKDVIQNLRQCTIAHFACHGEADQADPLRSKLLLQDWGSKPLRVNFLMRMELANCQLAYLSACQTAVNQNEALAEEGLHLSGAFQMAGVPNIIATSWNIDDKEAVGVAVQFYMGLMNEVEELDVSRSARSLHATLLDMRNRGLSPYVWVAYAHFGA